MSAFAISVMTRDCYDYSLIFLVETFAANLPTPHPTRREWVTGVWGYAAGA
jgi:hypothetical protein